MLFQDDQDTLRVSSRAEALRQTYGHMVEPLGMDRGGGKSDAPTVDLTKRPRRAWMEAYEKVLWNATEILACT